MTTSQLRKWRVTKSWSALQDPWISVRAESCVTQRDIVVDPFYVLDYPDWVHVVAVDDADHVLLVRQYRHGAGVFSLELPGGMMEPHETDVLVAAARELSEETGYVAGGLRHLVKLSPNPSTHANALHGVLATNIREEGGVSFDPSEDIEVVRLPWREAVDLAMSGGMINAQHIGLLLIGVRAAKGL